MLKYYWNHYFNPVAAKDAFDAFFRGTLIGLVVIALCHLWITF